MPRRARRSRSAAPCATAVAEVMRDPETARQLAERGYQTVAGTPEDHQARTNALVSQWIEVGRTVNLKE